MNRYANSLNTLSARTSRWLATATALFALLCSGLAFAQQTNYVSDVFYVPVRSGAGTQFRIVHQGLRSGTAVQVHETQEGWARITTDGVEGWMEAQYLLANPPARVQMPKLEQRLKQAQEQNAKYTARIRELEQENSTLQSQVSQLEEAHSAAVAELEEIRSLSEDAINLNQRHRELLEQHQMLQTEVNTLEAENDRLRSDTTVDKWLFGAGLVLFGIFLSIVLPALKPKKRFSDWA